MTDELLPVPISETLLARVTDEELSRQNKEFRLPREQLRGVRDEVVEQSERIASLLLTESQARRRAAQRVRAPLRRPQIWFASVLVISSIAFLSANANVIFGTPTQVGWIALAVMVGALAGGLVVIRSPTVALIEAIVDHRGATRRYLNALRSRVAEAIRVVINRRLSPEAQWGNEFDSVYAPQLVGVPIDNAVFSKTYEEIVAFVAEHPTSAIGIAGPRGVGKSTLMEQLRFEPRLGSLAVRIPAPKRYEAAALVRLIHREVIAEILGPRAVQRPEAAMATTQMAVLRRVLSTFLMIAAIALLSWAWADDHDQVSYNHRDVWPISTPKVLILLGIGAVAGILIRSAWRTLWTLRTRPATRSRVEHLARRQLDALNFASEVQSKAGWKWTLGPVGGSGEEQLGLTERQLTDADQVGRLRGFLEDLHAKLPPKTPVIICLDELDKIDKAEDVVSVINGVKDLFHLPGVHVLVSVSTDAMHTFAARGVLVRDVFDSAFDTVLEVRRLTAAESREVLTRRATRFSVPAMYFCHVWAGGHPRDLIRAARSCVQLRAQCGSALPLGRIVEEVLLQDVLDLLRAAADLALGDKPAADGPPPVADEAIAAIIVYRELLEELAGPLHERVAEVSRVAELPDDVTGTTEASSMVRVLRSYVDFAVCVSEFFSVERTLEDWQSDRTSAIVGTLAETQATLSRHPSEAARAVHRTRHRMNDFART